MGEGWSEGERGIVRGGGALREWAIGHCGRADRFERCWLKKGVIGLNKLVMGLQFLFQKRCWLKKG